MDQLLWICIVSGELIATPDFFTRNKRWLLPLIVLSVAIFVSMVLGAIRTEIEEEETERLALLVETRPLQLEPKTLQVHSQGLVQPKFQTELVAEVSGTLVRVHDSFVRGDKRFLPYLEFIESGTFMGHLKA